MKISVVIPTFNRANLLLRAIESVENQSFKADEIIVVDDGSSDNTSQLLEALNITYIFKENGGVSSARNLGVKKAKNSWIAFLDSDDYWDKRKLEKQILLHHNSNLLISQTEEMWVREKKRVTKPKQYKKRREDLFLHSLELCSITPSSILIHKKVFDDVGLFDESLIACEDYDMWLRITKKYIVDFVDEELITKTAGHGDQLSFNTPYLDLYRLKALKKHLDCEKALKIYQRKREILLNGAKKHNNRELLKELENLGV